MTLQFVHVTLLRVALCRLSLHWGKVQQFVYTIARTAAVVVQRAPVQTVLNVQLEPYAKLCKQIDAAKKKMDKKTAASSAVETERAPAL
jgi:hypothetical protein